MLHVRLIDPDVQFLQALADPVRLSIVRQVAGTEGVCACDFTECCTVSQPTVSHHLRILREAGVLTSVRRGTNVIYSLSPGFHRRWSTIGTSVMKETE
jgi:ArsR family transcriptional regulator, arsenate/arsenite/antimonite-responsive transcriptional repressor